MVIPALLVVVLAVLIGTGPAFISQRTEALPVEPTPYVKAEDAGATIYNLALFFVLLVTATAVIYIMFTRRRLLSLFLSFIWFVLSVGVFQFYVIMYYWAGFIDEVNAVRLMWASLLFGALTVFLLRRRRGDLLLGFLGSLAGAMFVWLLPPATVVALLAALPIYDYVMVSKGLLGKMVRRSRQMSPSAGGGEGGKADTPLFGFVVRLKTLSLGVGDFVVYSMALSFLAMRLMEYGRDTALIAVSLGAVLIYFGLKLTVEVFLKRWGYGPALPFPMLLLSPLIALAWFF
ncbi:hypothetical protein PYWP30_00652 [Pyrobaculum sp. WP30]|nr:hypothetical protein PYWP30_00652 [Pyrobaculum sp. WP30]